MQVHRAVFWQFFLLALLNGVNLVTAPLFAAHLDRSGGVEGTTTEATGQVLDGIVAVSTSGSVRVLGISTFPPKMQINSAYRLNM